MKHLLLITIMTVALAPVQASAEQIKLLDDSDYVWETTPEGVAFASLQGDRFNEAYQALVRLPAGTVSPPHTKSANMFGIMLQGEMIHYASGQSAENARKMGAGSYYSIPKGMAHISACVSDLPCVAYLYQDGAFDFKPVQP
jgi:quercetin dioxygenase-like cupin family protein